MITPLRFPIRLLGVSSGLTIFAALLLGCTQQEDTASQVTSAVPAAEEGQLVRIYEMVLRPDAAEEWSRMQRDEAIPALIAGGYPWAEVWRAGGAGNAYYRSIIVPLNDLSELDETAVFSRALGEEAARDLLARHRELVTSIETKIVRTRPDLSIGPRPNVSGVGILTTVTIANGRTAEFEERLRTSVAPELRQNNVSSFSVGQVLYGGAANQYFTLLEFADSGGSQEAVRLVTKGHPTALEWALGRVGVSRVADEPNSPVVEIDKVILRFDESLSVR